MNHLKCGSKPRFVSLLATIFLLLLTLAFPAYGKPLEIQWFSPYQNRDATLKLPSDDQIDTYFSFRASVNPKYNAVLVRAAINNDEVYYYYPAHEGIVEGVVYLRFGEGRYDLEINLVKPDPARPDLIKFDWLARTEVENTAEGDRRYLLPSWGIESDNEEIIAKAREITDGIDDPYQKVLAIHDWVSKNIAYDVEKYEKGLFYSNDGALQTLQQKKGLCRDYANLTTAFCRSIGIEARTVIGQAGINSKKFGHAWNEVRVNGRWIHLDTTWDAGRLQNGKFVSSFSRLYFDSKLFEVTHIKIQEVY